MNLKDKVVYQIYPKSFKDSNNDGIGDICGIVEKLDYLQLLGVDYLWITPIYLSPQNDNGYDISDYYRIDPAFGSMEDFDQLIREAGKRNISIMLDLVFNHTSTEHEWFQRALGGEERYKAYYLFRQGKVDNPPTNWESKFKGSAWKYEKECGQYYLHLFHETQADLDWRNHQVREEAAKVVNFWLDKGVKGFRFDVINLIDKTAFEDDDLGDGRRFYTDGPLVHTYLNELNSRSFGKFPGIMTVGECSSTTLENCIGYTKPENNELSMVFNFHHLKVDYDIKRRWNTGEFDFLELKQVLNQWQTGMQEGGGWSALFWCCHDQPRILSRYGDDKNYPKESAKMLATALHLMRGTPYIYQGEEIGMTNADFDKLEQYRDIDARNSYQCMISEGMKEEDIFRYLKARSRDNARTPMQWSDAPNAGFSDVCPWMDVPDFYHTINAAKCLEDEDSIFYYYRRLIQLRKEYQIIQEGRYVPLLENHDAIFAYKRVLDGQELRVYNNFFSGSPIVYIDSGKYDIMLSNVKRKYPQDEITMKPYESIVLIKK